MSALDLNNIQTYIINLDSRPDRWADIQKQISFLREDQVTRFSAVNKNNLPAVEVEAFKDGAWGRNLEDRYVAASLACLKSHVDCLNHAKRSGYPYVLILEDDAVFESYAPRVMAKAFQQVEAFNWDVLFLGGKLKTKKGGKASRVAKNLLRVRKLRLAHAYIVNEQAYDKIINEALSKKVPIDWYYSDFLQDAGTSYLVDPPVAFQKEDAMSDIAGQVVHKKKIKNKLRRLIGYLRSFI